MNDWNEQTQPAEVGEFIARVYRWDGDAICAAFLEALTEANFHQLREKIELTIEFEGYKA